MKTKLLMLLPAALIGLLSSASLAEKAVVIPAPKLDEVATQGTQTAIFAGGCFWGVQGVFQHVRGVVSATSGYAGGTATDATYDSVSSGATGHAEAVQIVYDPAKVSYGDLLHIFFSVVADPTTLNFQGPDHGPQYRSAIFASTPAQAQIARAYIADLDAAHVFGAPIVTAVEGKAAFFAAEDYHQDFLTLNPNYPYIAINDLPKVADLQRLFPEAWQDKPVLVLN
jgi:peptide-methionine (S)-S-oxide reductase